MVARISIGATKDDVRRLSSENPGWRVELEPDGTLTISPPAGYASGVRYAVLTAKMQFWGESHGYIVGDSSGGVALPNGAVVAPDTTLIAADRWRQLSLEEREDFVPIVPDVAVELVSKTDRPAETRRRLQGLRSQGILFVVMIDPYRDEVWTDGTAPEDFPTDFNDVIHAADA
jgi:Uma2 family endonuclease